MTRAARRHINPHKLLLSTWTAMNPRQREKHFMVVELVLPEPPETAIRQVVLEAVMTRRRVTIDWRQLQDDTAWLQGWRSVLHPAPGTLLRQESQ